MQHLNQQVERRKKSLKKLKRVKKANHNNADGTREIVKLGSRLTFSYREVDAENYLGDVIKECDERIKRIQHDSKKKNLGFAFVSFKNKDCVFETIDEIELVRQNLMTDQKVLRLGIKDWQVNEAYPPTDIIWSEIHHLSRNQGSLKPFCLYVLNTCLSVVLLGTLIWVDR